MQQPLISVIIPIHNGEKYLTEFLDSVQKQTYKNIELICVLNGSTDNSKTIIEQKSLSDDRIYLFEYSKGNAGFARNEGIKKAKGDFFIFLDCDDFFEPNFIERMVDSIIRTNSDITLCDVSFFDDFRKKNKKTSAYLNRVKLNKREFIFPANFCNNICTITSTVVWNRLYKASFIKENQLYFQEIASCNDMFFSVISLLLAKKISFVYETLVHYRINQVNSITKKSLKNFNDIIAVTEKLLLYINENKILNFYKTAVMELIVYHIVAHYIKLKDKKLQNEMLYSFESVLIFHIKDFNGIKCNKRSFNYIFTHDFLKKKKNFMSILLGQSRYFRAMVDVI